MIKFCIFVLLVQSLEIRANCDYEQMFRGNFMGIKLTPIPNGYVIPNKQSNSNAIMISGEHFMLYCSGGFKWYNSESQIKNLLVVFCEGTQLLFSNNINSTKESFHRSYGQYFLCNSLSVNLHAGLIDHCDYEGLRYGINIKDVPVVSLELCYDYNNSEVIFTHYIAAQRSAVLASQIEYNPSNVTQAHLSSESLVNLQNEVPPLIVLQNQSTIFVPRLKHLISEIDYKYSELASNTLLPSLNISSFRQNFTTLNSVPWWTPLRVGNWAVFQKILSRQVERQSYSIYAGKSHRAFFPKEFVCDSETDMTFDFDGRRKSIPLYIWNYIIPRQQEKDNQEFVLLGINSPFIEARSNNSLVICEDVCDRIPWLKLLETTRKMSSFGYMFCCKPAEVYSVLEGFPIKMYDITKTLLNYSRPAGYE